VLQITLVGTGTAFTRRYGHTNSLIEAGAVRLMVDFGFTSPLRLDGLSRSLKEITHVAVSHIHADHVGGLEELAFMSRFVFRRKPTLLLPEGLADDLWSTALRGGLELTADERGEPLYCTIDTYFDVIRLGADWVDLGAVRIKAFPNDHVPGKLSSGFIVRDADSGEQAIFGCDVRKRLQQLEREPIAEDFAVGPVFHDCQLFDDGPSGVHIPYAKLLKYPQSVLRRLILVHYNDSILDHLPTIYKDGFSIAWPGDVIRVPGWEESVRRNREANSRNGH